MSSKKDDKEDNTGIEEEILVGTSLDEKNWENELEFILNLISNLRSCKSYKIFPQLGDENYNLRRASVAIVLRFNFDKSATDLNYLTDGSSTNDFEDLHKASLEAMGFSSFKRRKDPDWRLSGLLQEARKHRPALEVLFMQRGSSLSDRWSGHVSFPGGKKDTPQDLTDFDTAARECLEEVGLDLKVAQNFFYLGELDDRLVKTRFGTSNLLILSPQIFIQVSKFTPSLKLETREVACADWVSIKHLLNFLNKPSVKKGSTVLNKPSHKLWHRIDLANHIFPLKNWSLFKYPEIFIRSSLKILLGGMYFSALPLPEPFAPTLLWGLTLGMVSDLVDLGHNPRQIAQITPLDYPLPSFDLWPINIIVRWFCKPHYLRKPVTSWPFSPWEKYFYVVKVAGFLILSTRLVIITTFFRYLYSRRRFAFDLFYTVLPNGLVKRLPA